MSPQHVTLLICMIQDDVGYLHRICTCHNARFTVKNFTYFLSPLLPVRWHFMESMDSLWVEPDDP